MNILDPEILIYFDVSEMSALYFSVCRELENVAREKNVNPVFKTNQTQLLTMIKNELKECAEKRGFYPNEKNIFVFR